MKAAWSGFVRERNNMGQIRERAALLEEFYQLLGSNTPEQAVFQLESIHSLMVQYYQALTSRHYPVDMEQAAIEKMNLGHLEIQDPRVIALVALAAVADVCTSVSEDQTMVPELIPYAGGVITALIKNLRDVFGANENTC